MATLREIRRRISGVKSTQKITKAMKMVSAAKLRRAQDGVVSARPYARTMKSVLRDLAAVVDVTANPLFSVRPPEKVAIVVVTADRGLCGAFNTNIIKAAIAHIKAEYGEQHRAGNVKLVCIGRKGSDFFTKNGYPVDAKYIGIFGTLGFENARQIVAALTTGFLGGAYDRVDIVFNEFKSIIQQKIVIDPFLPIPAGKITDADPKGLRAPSDYIYEPSGEKILSTLVPKHLNFQLWRTPMRPWNSACFSLGADVIGVSGAAIVRRAYTNLPDSHRLSVRPQSPVHLVHHLAALPIDGGGRGDFVKRLQKGDVAGGEGAGRPAAIRHQEIEDAGQVLAVFRRLGLRQRQHGDIIGQDDSIAVQQLAGIRHHHDIGDGAADPVATGLPVTLATLASGRFRRNGSGGNLGPPYAPGGMAMVMVTPPFRTPSTCTCPCRSTVAVMYQDWIGVRMVASFSA